MLDLSGCLPKNMNGIRTTHTCELCGFEPKTKNKYREKQDHLVMKHFKEKIDKIFPHCRPYSCPSEDCSFTGKDKQALLRHYTGKHGILERYLREALAENGIQYLPGEHGSKRRCSLAPNGNAKMMKQSPPHYTTSTTILDPKDLLPNTPLPMEIQASRPNTEDLRKEVEALMASFQPQSQDPQMMAMPQLIPINLPQSSSQRQPQQLIEDVRNIVNGSMQLKVIELPKHPISLQQRVTSNVPISIQNVINNPSYTVNTIPEMITPSSSPLPSLILSNMPQVSLPSMGSETPTMEDTLIRTSPTPPPLTPKLPNTPLPLELISGSNGLVTSAPTTTTSTAPSSIIFSTFSSHPLFMSSGSIIENKEVMWGGGPAVVVESSDSIPITYIETADGSFAAMLDAIDYDMLVPSINGVDPMHERQLDFCTF